LGGKGVRNRSLTVGSPLGRKRCPGAEKVSETVP
jgi:hypothetical protein